MRHTAQIEFGVVIMNRRQSLLLMTSVALPVLPSMAQTTSSTGEVVKVDKAAARITLKHNGIKNLDVPAMTLVLRVNNAALLNDIEAGDRVRFQAERVDGQYTITTLNKVP
jgi:Cu(I)/Ag(I) efflux system periplasmic protein CusF